MMIDLVFIIGTLLFFVISIGVIQFFDLLHRGE